MKHAIKKREFKANLSEKHKKTLLKQMLIQQKHHKEDNIEAFNSVGYFATQ